MRTLIISGGTGSIRLKEELSKFIDRRNLKTLINCYDNGLSTGLVRKVFNGEILGPSDARKQQFLDYELYRDEIKTESSENIFKKLKVRATIYKDPENYIKNELKDMPKEIVDAVETYFNMPLSKQIKYIDFSLANIVYGGLANNFGSLQAAVDCMADLLNLPKNIIINDDESLFLCALTENGTEIHDESEIVDWSNPNNKIVDVFLTDIKGKRKLPTLSKRAIEVIDNSDLVICSPGTQFSSLIPTYISKGFLEAIEDKKVYLIKNAFQDKDMLGYSHQEELEKVMEYLPSTHINKIFTHVKLNETQKIIMGDYISDGKHNSKLVEDILDEYYDYSGEKGLLFDYDDTIFSRSDDDIDISLENIKLVSEINNETYLFTGKRMSEIDDNLAMDKYFTCYGSSVYDTNRSKIETYSYLTPTEIKDIIGALREISFNFSKIENRDNAIVSLRFLEEDYRNVLHKYFELRLPNLKVIKAGKQTIDIMKKDNCKISNFRKAFEKDDDLFYVGDEVDGNDKDMISELKSLHVKDVLCTNTFLKYLKLKGN